jgi:hypothetical protein
MTFLAAAAGAAANELELIWAVLVIDDHAEHRRLGTDPS